MKILSSAALAALFACPAVAHEAKCWRAENVAQYLSKEHQEHFEAYGIATNGVMLQIWVNDQTGTFTIVAHDGKNSCMVYAGDGFTKLTPEPNL